MQLALSLSRRHKAHVLIHNASAVAAGIGAGWLTDLWSLPDALPLGLMQAGLVTGIGLLFLLRPPKALLLGLVAAFVTALLGRGLAFWLFLRLPEHEATVNMLVAALLTEALGWSTYMALLSLRPRPGPHSLVHAALQATRHGPWRVLLCSAPMGVAVLATLVVLNVHHQVEVRLRAPGGAEPLAIDHPLVERYEGTLQISGTPRGRAGRVELPVRNNQLAAELERRVLVRPAPRVRVLAWVAADAPIHVVDRTWQVEVRTGSDYWERVRGRLFLLLPGLLGVLALLWLGRQRSAPAA